MVRTYLFTFSRVQVTCGMALSLDFNVTLILESEPETGTGAGRGLRALIKCVEPFEGDRVRCARSVPGWWLIEEAGGGARFGRLGAV